MNDTIRLLRSSTSYTATNTSHHHALVEQSSHDMDVLRRIYEDSLIDSSIRDHISEYPQFLQSELILGMILGKGGFGTVWEVKRIYCENDVRNVDLDGDTDHSRISFGGDDISVRSLYGDGDDTGGTMRMESRKFIAQHCLRKGTDPRYAIKQLSPETIQKPSKREQGLIDMAIETRMLSGIVHPNIVKMRATAQCGPFSDGYFIVMDRLYDTLEKRIKDWETRAKRIRGFTARLTDPKGTKALALYEERLHAAYDLGAAIEYLHSKHIIYRDIKPENAAFDIRGDIKIFDFGLAKELKDSLENDDGTYNLTGMTGSPRYMCNHVANSEPYNASCDVYSFCVMFWQMMALKVPYKGYNMRDLFEKVYNGPCVRPDIKASWHTSIKLMLKRGWSHDLVSRSTMKHVVSILRSELIATRNGDSTGLTHHTRRSTFIFRGLAASFGNVGRSQRVQLETVDSVRLDDDDDVEDEDDDDMAQPFDD